MPMDKSRYAPNWDAIALVVKRDANWTCQNCGRPCRKPGEDWMYFVEKLACLEEGGQWYVQTSEQVFDDETGGLGIVEKPQRFTLTVAHLDQDPSNNDPSNLKALCSVCHLEHDRPHRLANRQRKLERKGQLNLLTD